MRIFCCCKKKQVKTQMVDSGYPESKLESVVESQKHFPYLVNFQHIKHQFPDGCSEKEALNMYYNNILPQNTAHQVINTQEVVLTGDVKFESDVES